jgi:hypothetical protein
VKITIRCAYFFSLHLFCQTPTMPHNEKKILSFAQHRSYYALYFFHKGIHVHNNPFKRMLQTVQINELDETTILNRLPSFKYFNSFNTNTCTCTTLFTFSKANFTACKKKNCSNWTQRKRIHVHASSFHIYK